MGGMALLFFCLISLPGCGGGSSPSPSPPTAVCTGTTPPGLSPSTANTMPVYQSTCAGAINTPTVTLKICVPSSSTCEDVPNILLDYGSTGLRLSHTLSISGELPQEQVSGQGLFECYRFVSGYNFGPVVTARITLGTSPVTVPLQISNSSLPAPSSCTQGGTVSSAPFQPYYNGILGVLFPQYDISSAYYYEGSGYSPVNMTSSNESLEVQNPVYLLASNNNGVLLSGLPAVSSDGASNVTGTLTFGISGKFTQLETNAYGYIQATITTYNNNSLNAFFDTGSNGFFIDNSSITSCTGNLAGFFCGNDPGQSAKLTGNASNSPSFSLSFSIVSAQTLFATGNNDFSTLGGYASGTFDAGFPAFLLGYPIGIEWGTSSCTPGCFLIGSKQ